jgi:hypothetical protein
MVWTDSPDHLFHGVGLTAFFAFYLTVATLDLGWELILVPLLTPEPHLGLRRRPKTIIAA